MMWQDLMEKKMLADFEARYVIEENSEWAKVSLDFRVLVDQSFI